MCKWSKCIYICAQMCLYCVSMSVCCVCVYVYMQSASLMSGHHDLDQACHALTYVDKWFQWALGISAYSVIVELCFLQSSLVHVGSSVISVARVFFEPTTNRVVYIPRFSWIHKYSGHVLVSRSQTAFMWKRSGYARLATYRGPPTHLSHTDLSISLSLLTSSIEPSPHASLVVRRLSQRQLHRAFVQTFFPHVYGYDRSRGIISRKLSWPNVTTSAEHASMHSS